MANNEQQNGRDPKRTYEQFKQDKDARDRALMPPPAKKPRLENVFDHLIDALDNSGLYAILQMEPPAEWSAAAKNHTMTELVPGDDQPEFPGMEQPTGTQSADPLTQAIDLSLMAGPSETGIDPKPTLLNNDQADPMEVDDPWKLPELLASPLSDYESSIQGMLELSEIKAAESSTTPGLQQNAPATNVTFPPNKRGSRVQHIVGFPPWSSPLPAGLTLEQICWSYPNHLIGRPLRQFIAADWNGRAIWDRLQDAARAAGAKSRGWSKYTKRLTDERNQMQFEADVEAGRTPRPKITRGSAQSIRFSQPASYVEPTPDAHPPVLYNNNNDNALQPETVDTIPNDTIPDDTGYLAFDQLFNEDQFLPDRAQQQTTDEEETVDERAWKTTSEELEWLLVNQLTQEDFRPPTHHPLAADQAPVADQPLVADQNPDQPLVPDHPPIPRRTTRGGRNQLRMFPFAPAPSTPLPEEATSNLDHILAHYPAHLGLPEVMQKFMSPDGDLLPGYSPREMAAKLHLHPNIKYGSDLQHPDRQRALIVWLYSKRDSVWRAWQRRGWSRPRRFINVAGPDPFQDVVPTANTDSGRDFFPYDPAGLASGQMPSEQDAPL